MDYCHTLTARRVSRERRYIQGFSLGFQKVWKVDMATRLKLDDKVGCLGTIELILLVHKYMFCRKI